jgi:hypothetical protein
MVSENLISLQLAPAILWIIGGFIRINERFGKELNSDIFHQSIEDAIGVYEKHPKFDDRTITSDNRDEDPLIIDMLSQLILNLLCLLIL